MRIQNREQKYFSALELDKILHMLAAETSCEDAASAALELRPCGDLEETKELLRQTFDAHMLVGRFGTPSFSGLKNRTNALRRAEAGGMLNMGELLGISQLLRAMRSLMEWRRHSEGVSTCIDEQFEMLYTNKYLEEKISSAILSEEEMADTASPELLDIRRKIRSGSLRIREQLDKMVRSSTYQKYLQEPIVTMRAGRFVVPVKAECRGEVAGLVHDTSSSGATVFIEPMSVVEANNEIKVLISREEAEIERILTELSKETGEFADDMIAGYERAVYINLVFAKAHLAYKMKATMPQINCEGKICLKKARHPLIDPEKVVATDIVLGYDFDTLVITGPNTGGKTVSLKTIGLFSLMAMCGLLLPVSDESSVSVFRNVLVDIGDEQSIEQSLSTFSSHMTNIIQILGQADDQSLILLDELGAGTDPVEGAALAMAIIESMRTRGVRLAATTHYAELKAYALQTEGVENACCEFDVATLRPTYRLLIGVPGRSNAFAISQRLGMPEEIVSRAQSLVSMENLHFEDVVQKLEKNRQELEKEKEEARHYRVMAQKAAKEAEELRAHVEREREKELEKARMEARRLVTNVRAQAEALIEEIDLQRKNKASSDAAVAKSSLRAGIRSIENAADPVEKKKEPEYRLPRPLKIGDHVLIYDVDKKGTVLSLPDSAGTVLVQAGIIKTKVPVKNLRLTKESNTNVVSAQRNVSRRVTSRSAVQVKTEVDLRGLTVSEALMELDQFIDNAVMSGLSIITIIHGKGTGALRAAVHDHLKAHPNIRTFRLGVYGEGENGVTIAELK